jgi:hypothetical protein
VSAARVILITVAGPRGHVDVGVRSDATPSDLADSLGAVIGVTAATKVVEHRSPPRPGVPDGGRALVGPGMALADVGVADGDLVLFRTADGGSGYSWPEVQARPAEFGAGLPPPRALAGGSPPIDPPRVPAVAASPGPANAAPAPPEPSLPAPPAAPLPAARAWAPADTSPDVRTAVPPAADSGPTSDDVWTAAVPEPTSVEDVRTLAAPEPTPADDIWTPAPPEPTPADDIWTPAAPEPTPADDIWAPPAPERPPATERVWTSAAGPSAWPIEDPQPPETWTATVSGQHDAQSLPAATQPDIGRPATGKRFMTAPRVSEPTAGRHARGSAEADEPQPDEPLELTHDLPTDSAGQPEQDQAWWHGSQEVNPDDWRG